MKRPTAFLLLVCGLLLVFTSGWLAGYHGQRIEIRQVDDVASYNDGFMDGKSDCNH